MRDITIDNRTVYREDDLRRIFSAVLRDYHRRVSERPRTIVVRCVYRRLKDGFCGGYAHYNSGNVCLKLPKEPIIYQGEPAVERIARTLHHELDHCRGLRHGEMTHDANRDLSCVTGLTLRKRSLAKPKATPTPDDKLTRLIERRKRWETKAKRCESALRKLTRQIRGYERRAAAATPPKGDQP